MTVPNMSLQTSSSSSSEAKGSSNSGFDNSGFTVNFGGAGGVSTGVPTWALVAAVGVVAWLVIKKG